MVLKNIEISPIGVGDVLEHFLSKAPLLIFNEITVLTCFRAGDSVCGCRSFASWLANQDVNDLGSAPPKQDPSRIANI